MRGNEEEEQTNMDDKIKKSGNSYIHGININNKNNERWIWVRRRRRRRWEGK